MKRLLRSTCVESTSTIQYCGKYGSSRTMMDGYYSGCYACRAQCFASFRLSPLDLVAAMTDSILCLCAGRFNGSQDSTLQVTVLGARRALRMRGHEERSFSSSGCLSVRPFVRYRRRRSGLAAEMVDMNLSVNRNSATTTQPYHRERPQRHARRALRYLLPLPYTSHSIQGRKYQVVVGAELLPCITHKHS